MPATDTASTHSTRSITGPGVAAGVAAFVLMLIGTYLDTPYKHGRQAWGLSDRGDLWELPLLAAFAALGAGVVFGVLVPGGLRASADRETRRALALGVAAVLSVLVFWTGLPVVLATGAVVLAIDARQRGQSGSKLITAAVALSAVAAALGVWAAFTG